MTLHGPIRLSLLAALLALGAVGATLALTGLGLSLPVAAVASGAAAGLVQYGALRRQPPAPPPDRLAERALHSQLGEYRVLAASLRHDLRGMLSPALLMSDRLVNHQDPTVVKAGQVVVRSIERATALLESNRHVMTADGAPAATEAEPDGTAPPR